MSDLHTKYRPDELDLVVGHADVKKSLAEALQKGLARAFVFAGPSGTGKTTLARIIAKEKNCPPANIMEIDAATNTGIDAMREVTKVLAYSSLHASNTKVIIVDEAHALSKAAWQSLLKSVEEPPPGVVWIFCTTELSKIPDTILTRCVVYELKPVKADDIFAVLQVIRDAEHLAVSDDICYFIATRSQGSPRRALVNLSKCSQCKTQAEAADLLAEAADEGDGIEIAKLLISGNKAWLRYREILQRVQNVNSEGIRLQIVNYLTKVLLDIKADDKAVALFQMIEAFSYPYATNAGVHPLALSVGRIIFAP